jgi:hypothetical protein
MRDNVYKNWEGKKDLDVISEAEEMDPESL